MVAYCFQTKGGCKRLVDYPSRQHAAGAELASILNEKLHGLIEGCSAAEARKWVKDGGLHETALYVNPDGKVRRATE